jgi:hypothetical protein
MSMSASHEQRWFSISEACEHTRLTRRKFDELRRQGKFRRTACLSGSSDLIATSWTPGSPAAARTGTNRSRT